mgnify:CR=1 FL=1
MRKVLLLGLTAALGAAPFGARAAGGAYASLPAADAAACARLCADDALCMAWSFQDARLCHLRATAPPEAPTGLAHGLSERASGELRRMLIRDSDILGPTASQADAAPPEASTGVIPAAQLDEADALDGMLLGGLETDETGLRN